MKYILISLCALIFSIGAYNNDLYAISSYQPDVPFTIPWGDSFGELSLWWKEPTGLPDPEYADWIVGLGPSAVSTTGGYVTVDESSFDIFRLTKYSNNGLLINQINLTDLNLGSPGEIYITGDGSVLLPTNLGLTLFNTNLQIVNSIPIPLGFISCFPSENGFWCLYTIDNQSDMCQDYIFEIYSNGTISDPALLFTGSCADTAYAQIRFVSPLGTTFEFITDKDNYIYFIDWYKDNGEVYYQLKKETFSGEVVYINNMQSVDDWFMMEFYPTWSGDYFTQHATEDGLVITKYILHHDPICDCLIVTPMPYCGPSPAAIQFDASGSYDEEGDELTFHWDFDGDCVFDEPIDDSYIGNPTKPIHEYTENGIYTVNLRVTDNYQGECETSVIVEVHIV